jgi:hypothetical protein
MVVVLLPAMVFLILGQATADSMKMTGDTNGEPRSVIDGKGHPSDGLERSVDGPTGGWLTLDLQRWENRFPVLLIVDSKESYHGKTEKENNYTFKRKFLTSISLVFHSQNHIS